MTHCTLKSIAVLILVASLGMAAGFSVSHRDGGVDASVASAASNQPLSPSRTIETGFPIAEAGFALHQPVSGF